VWEFPPLDNDLLSQHGVLDDEFPSCANGVDPDAQCDAGRRVGSQCIEQRPRSRPKPAYEVPQKVFHASLSSIQGCPSNAQSGAKIHHHLARMAKVASTGTSP